MSTHSTEKVRRYIASLDTARCNESWQEVPELVRKVQKHAPERKCLIATANAECQVAAHVSSRRPSTATTKPTTSLPDLIPTLLSAIEGELKHQQDILQAQTCLGWIHWTLAEPALTASRLPKDYSATIQTLSKDNTPISDWTEVCVVKGACMKGTAQSQSGALKEAIETFQSLFPWLQSRVRRSPSSKQFSYWSDQYLAQFALVASKDQYIVPDQEALALNVFRSWAGNGEKHRDPTLDSVSAFVFSPRSQTWKSYYQFLSRLLQRGYVYPDEGDLAPRLQQYTELKRVETIHENILLKTVRFPKAHDSSIEIESWVDQVIRNWEVLCGPAWTDRDVGQGGREAVGRTVLDILYRAAARSFHSTVILRRLFQVHKSLAEFNLAYKALDTYIDIIAREKAKAAKSGDAPTYVDDEMDILRTLAEGIDGLCCFGTAKQAEKANTIAKILSGWVKAQAHQANGTTNGDPERRLTQSPSGQYKMETISTAYRAIGVAEAQWARYTPFTENRSSIQKEAIEHLKISLTLKPPSSPNYEAHFALGLLLAETRDLNGAVAYVKEALAFQDLSSIESESSGYVKERKTIPLWHLLALILSARQDFSTAERACEGAFEQFSSPRILFGQTRNKEMNGHVDKSSEKIPKFSTYESEGLVYEMEGIELERIIQIRLTEVALLEVVEGPETAVNSTHELLSLFVRLFGRQGINLEGKPAAKTLAPPKSSAGTVKSFRGSIFSRKKGFRSSLRHSVLPDRSSAINEKGPASRSSATNAPIIEVTDETRRIVPQSQPNSGHQHHKLHRHEGSINRMIRQHSDHQMKPRPASSYVSSSRQSFETGREGLSRDASTIRERRLHTSDGHNNRRENQDIDATSLELPPPAPSATAGVTQSSSAKQDLPEIPHSFRRNDVPLPTNHKEQPPEQDIRLPTSSPHTSARHLPRFPKAQSQKHALGILIKIWLVIAALYRRASMFEDSREACDEASKHASHVESLVAAQQSSAEAFADPGWGGTKSSDELWADVHTETGLLALARSLPHDAMDHFEQALSYFPDHGQATVALSSILLDIYAQEIPAERLRPGLDAGFSQSNLPLHIIARKGASVTETTATVTSSATVSNGISTSESRAPPTSRPSAADDLRKTPENLNRLATRDRAYGLLSTYTKLGSGWDDSEAWLALARAHEQSGQVDKAREVLWWCVELEDTRPVRHWKGIGGGGYVL